MSKNSRLFVFCENPIGENETYNKVCSIIEEGKLPSELQNTDVGVIYNNPEFGVQYSLLGVTKTIDVARIKAQNQLMRAGKQFPLLTSVIAVTFLTSSRSKCRNRRPPVTRNRRASNEMTSAVIDGDWPNETIEEIKACSNSTSKRISVLADDDGKVMNIGKIRNYLKKTINRYSF